MIENLIVKPQTQSFEIEVGKFWNIAKPLIQLQDIGTARIGTVPRPG
jgi:hypothetical protein